MAEEKRQFNVTHSGSSGGSSGGGKISKGGSGGSSSGGSKLKDAIGAAVSKGKEVVNNAKNKASAYSYLNRLIASGASKDKVSNEIAIALREGAITAKQAQQLRSVFTPRGVQY